MFIRTVKFTLHSWLLLPVIAGAAGWGGYSLGAGKRPAGKDAPTNTPEPKSSAVAAPAAPDMPLVLKTRDLAVPADLSGYRPEYLECWRVIRDFSADQVKSALSQIGEVAARPSTPAVRRMLYFRWGQLDPAKAMAAAQKLENAEGEVYGPSEACLTAWLRKDPETAYRWCTDPKNKVGGIAYTAAPAFLTDDAPRVLASVAPLGEPLPGMVVDKLAQTESHDPAKREAFLKMLSANGTPDQIQDGRASVYNYWAEINPREAIDAATASGENPTDTRRFQQAVLTRWSNIQPAAALDWMTAHPDAIPLKKQLETYEGWLRRKPLEAERWLDENPVRREFHGGITRILFARFLPTYRSTLSEGKTDVAETLRALKTHYTRWKSADPQEAGQWLTPINSDIRRKLEGGTL